MSSHAAVLMRRVYANGPHADDTQKARALAPGPSPVLFAVSLGDRGVHDFFPRGRHLTPEVERQKKKNIHCHDEHENNQDHTPESELWQCHHHLH